MTRTARLLEPFKIRWFKPAPITARQAAAVLSKVAADQRTAKERMTDRLRAERDAGWPGAAVTR